VGAYFKEGFSPIPVYISDKYRRAVRGGVGAAKTGGNYAASLFVSDDVAARGYSQVLWLDAIKGRYIEEVGAMNICFVYDGNRIVTPPLSDSILAGVTRDSVLRMAPDLGYDVVEEAVDVFQMLADLQSGRVTEVFGCGTAAVIAPVGKFGLQEDEYIINENKPGPVSEKLFQALTDIQYGRVEDKYDWTLKIEANQ
jgi:branched-chain amino acid aminotransferase